MYCYGNEALCARRQCATGISIFFTLGPIIIVTNMQPKKNRRKIRKIPILAMYRPKRFYVISTNVHWRATRNAPSINIFAHSKSKQTNARIEWIRCLLSVFCWYPVHCTSVLAFTQCFIHNTNRSPSPSPALLYVNSDECACPCFHSFRTQQFTHYGQCVGVAWYYASSNAWRRHEFLNENKRSSANTSIHVEFIHSFLSHMTESELSFSFTVNCAKNSSINWVEAVLNAKDIDTNSAYLM